MKTIKKKFILIQWDTGNMEVDANLVFNPPKGMKKKSKEICNMIDKYGCTTIEKEVPIIE